MKMKKYLVRMAALIACAPLFLTSCDDSNDGPSYRYEVYSDDAFIVNSGNMANHIDGSLTAIHLANGAVQQKAFAMANDGQSLGSVPNDGLVYGDKVYVVVDQSNAIMVLNRKTLKLIKKISTTDLMGAQEGAEPRHIIAGNGHVFFTTYGGYLAAVDTVNYALTAKTKVGSFPEGLAGYGNTIIVANSDYARGNGTISVVDLNTFQADTRSIQGIHNPQKVFIVDGNVYVLDWSYYEGEWPNSVEKGESALRYVTNMTSSKVADAYYASLLDGKFYIISDPYGTPAYSVCDVTANATSGVTTPLYLSEGVYSPAGIEVDPGTGNIYVLSYNAGDGGYADYSADGYVQVYSAAGAKLSKYNTGVGPCAVFFNMGVKAVPYKN